jgi:hypothetical protein
MGAVTEVWVKLAFADLNMHGGSSGTTLGSSDHVSSIVAALHVAGRHAPCLVQRVLELCDQSAADGSANSPFLV